MTHDRERIKLRTIAIWAAALALIWWQRRMIGALLALLLLSATIGYMVTPLSRFLEKKLSRKWGPPLAFFALLLIVAAWFWSFLPPLIRQAIALAEELPAIWEQMTAWATSLEARVLEMGIPKEAVADIAGQLTSLGTNVFGSVGDGLAGLAKGASNIGWMILSPILAYYMVRDRRGLFDRIERCIPSRARLFALGIAGGARDALRGYVRGQVIVSIITGAITSAGLLIIGTPSWLLLGFLMMIFNLIPYFGPVIGAVPILIIAGTQGLFPFIQALIVVVAAQQIESIFVQPRIMADAADIHPALVILGLLAGGMIAGIAGMVFALPVMLIIRVVAIKALELKLYGKENEAGKL